MENDLDVGDGVGEGSLEEQGEICLDLLSKKNNLGESGSGFFFKPFLGISSEGPRLVVEEEREEWFRSPPQDLEVGLLLLLRILVDTHTPSIRRSSSICLCLD